MEEKRAGQINRNNLREYIRTRYSDTELRDLCFQLNIDYESLEGGNRDAKARELVTYCERHDLTGQLIATLRQDRPAQFDQAFPAGVVQTTPIEQTPDQPPGPTGAPAAHGGTPAPVTTTTTRPVASEDKSRPPAATISDPPPPLPRSWKDRLKSIDYKWAIGLVIAAIACIAAWLVVPEFRQWLGLDKLTPTAISTRTPTLTPTSSPTPTATPTPTPAPRPYRVGFRCTLSSTGNNNDQLCEDVFEIRPQPVSSISISMTNRAIPIYGYSIWEVEAYESITSTTNVITATAGVQATATSNEDDRRLPQDAIDGNMLTRWASAWSDKPDGKDPQVLTITFPRPVTIGRIVIKWQDAYAQDYCVGLYPASACSLPLAPTKPPTPVTAVQTPTFFFADDFNGTEIDLNRWDPKRPGLSVQNGYLVANFKQGGKDFGTQSLEAKLNHTRFQVVELSAAVLGGSENGVLGLNTSCGGQSNAMYFEIRPGGLIEGSYDAAAGRTGLRWEKLAAPVVTYTVRLMQDGDVVRAYVNDVEMQEPYPCPAMGDWFVIGAGASPQDYIQGHYDYVRLGLYSP